MVLDHFGRSERFSALLRLDSAKAQKLRSSLKRRGWGVDKVWRKNC